MNKLLKKIRIVIFGYSIEEKFNAYMTNPKIRDIIKERTKVLSDLMNK